MQRDLVVIAVIPAFDAVRNIADVVRAAKAHVSTCIVVNDGSTDGTGACARAAGAEVIDHPHNMGKGAGLRTAIEHLRCGRCDYVILLDADGQHDPKDIPRFVAYACTQHADMVCGTRMNNPEGMPWLRRLTNRTMSGFLSWLCRVKLTDTQCGYRLLSARAISAIELRKNNFEVESEMLIQAVVHGLIIGEVPINTIYGDDHASHIKPLLDTARFISLVWHLSLRRFMT